MAATISGFQLEYDTGPSSSDGITNNPSVIGTLVLDEDTTSATIEIDHTGDSVADFTSTEYTGTDFFYDPLAVDGALESWDGPLPIRYRAIAHETSGDVVGDWTDFPITLDRVEPTVSSLSPGDGGTFDPASDVVRVIFDEAVDSAAFTPNVFWVQSTGTANLPPQTIDVINDTTVEISIDAADLTALSYTTWLDPVGGTNGLTDLAGNNLNDAHTATWENSAPAVPTIGPVSLTNDTGISSSDLITSDDTIAAAVTWTSPDTTDVTVEFDHDGDGAAEGSWFVWTSGDEFSYAPSGSDSSLYDWEGELTIRYRPVAHGSAGDIVGPWSSFTFTLDAVAPTVTGFTPGEGNVFNTGPTEAVVTFHEDVDAGSLGTSTIYVQETLTWETPSQTPTASGGEVTITFGGSELEPGQYVTEVTDVKDLAGNAAEWASVAWRVNAAPTATAIPDIHANMNDPQIAFDLHDYFEDEYDSDSDLAYSIVSNTNPALFSSTDAVCGQLVLDLAVDQSGTAHLVIRATDTNGLSVDTTVSVLVNAAPIINGFVGIQNPMSWTFQGTVADDQPVAGLEITLGGIIPEATVYPNTGPNDFSRTFEYTVTIFDIPYDGWVTAQTVDSQGLVSNVAKFWVSLS